MSRILTELLLCTKAPYIQGILQNTRTCLRLSTVKFCKQIQEVVLCESELEEKFVKGFGKGGQKVNKTSNCVELKHIPTGITVKCHQTRYLERNRTLARDLLCEKLDYFYNGKESKIAKNWEKIRKRKADYVRKRNIKNKLLELDKGSEDNN
ncbi:probable peptide chain release factor C12orf65, mitochondrial [Dendronephthya gigantea]|uniref:probable peptide chain release factor C12orf65, mitochondrial n=1 Tax=Dendronephthya gigantea TaxID=151771 RepID=UPI00106AB440|nr:probable peptide chain release factor C12orf65, mitochondrial [Dendronephthya gigantea]XP_028415226.1 probable peptide chain release factor C12orf65, mitochondrial [Dendronephthya gigantea]